jgi:hypothetical protein
MSHQEEIDQLLATRDAAALQPPNGIVGPTIAAEIIFDDFDFCCVAFILYALNSSGERQWFFLPIEAMPAWGAGEYQNCPTCGRRIQRIVREGSSSIWRRETEARP